MGVRRIILLLTIEEGKKPGLRRHNHAPVLLIVIALHSERRLPNLAGSQSVYCSSGKTTDCVDNKKFGRTSF